MVKNFVQGYEKVVWESFDKQKQQIKAGCLALMCITNCH